MYSSNRMSKVDIFDKHGTSHSSYIPISHLSHQEVEGLVAALLRASAAKRPTAFGVTLLDEDTWGTFPDIFVATKPGVFFIGDLGIFSDVSEETKTGVYLM